MSSSNFIREMILREREFCAEYCPMKDLVVTLAVVSSFVGENVQLDE